jgi:DNA-binding NarL/FixJ family response regulator
MASQRIVIVDDHPLFRDALKQSLASAIPGVRVEEAGNLDAAVKLLESNNDIDLVLLDLKMPGVQGLSGLAYLRAQFPAVAVAVVSGSEEPHLIRRAMGLGASGYIPKSTATGDIKVAIAAILAGDIWTPPDLVLDGGKSEGDVMAKRLATLTPQQLRVLMMLREGLLNKQIAYELDVSEATVKAHVSAILQKLDVDSRTQAVIAVTRIDEENQAQGGSPV